jgi:hypothetical protein
MCSWSEYPTIQQNEYIRVSISSEGKFLHKTPAYGIIPLNDAHSAWEMSQNAQKPSR